MPIQSATNCTNTELQTSEFKQKFQHRPVCKTNLGALSAKAPTLQGRLETWLLAQRNIPQFPARLEICRARLQKTAACQPAKFQYPGKGSCHLPQDFHHQTGTSSTLPKQAAKLGSSSKLQPTWQELNTKATARPERLTCQSFNTAGSCCPGKAAKLQASKAFPTRVPTLRALVAIQTWQGCKTAALYAKAPTLQGRCSGAKGKKPMKLQKPQRNQKIQKIKKIRVLGEIAQVRIRKMKNLEKIKKIKKMKKSRP